MPSPSKRFVKPPSCLLPKQAFPGPGPARMVSRVRTPTELSQPTATPRALEPQSGCRLVQVSILGQPNGGPSPWPIGTSEPSYNLVKNEAASLSGQVVLGRLLGLVSFGNVRWRLHRPRGASLHRSSGTAAKQPDGSNPSDGSVELESMGIHRTGHILKLVGRW